MLLEKKKMKGCTHPRKLIVKPWHHTAQVSKAGTQKAESLLQLKGAHQAQRDKVPMVPVCTHDGPTRKGACEAQTLRKVLRVSSKKSMKCG